MKGFAPEEVAMYEYVVLKGSNEVHLEEKVNAAAADGWEVLNYSIRPTGGVFLIFIGALWGDHFAMPRRPLTAEG